MLEMTIKKALFVSGGLALVGGIFYLFNNHPMMKENNGFDQILDQLVDLKQDNSAKNNDNKEDIGSDTEDIKEEEDSNARNNNDKSSEEEISDHNSDIYDEDLDLKI